ncbi:MAG: hypothetical protein HYZ14_05500 [Bacteroidetes bacterium]|nr:hypothetical protein [Bacteroidota bacterium]
MKSIGLGLMGIAALAMVLYFIDYVPTYLEWIYKWGNGVAWGLMVGIFALGGVLAYLGMKSEKTDKQSQG